MKVCREGRRGEGRGEVVGGGEGGGGGRRRRREEVGNGGKEVERSKEGRDLQLLEDPASLFNPVEGTIVPEKPENYGLEVIDLTNGTITVVPILGFFGKPQNKMKVHVPNKVSND